MQWTYVYTYLLYTRDLLIPHCFCMSGSIHTRWLYQELQSLSGYTMTPVTLNATSARFRETERYACACVCTLHLSLFESCQVRPSAPYACTQYVHMYVSLCSLDAPQSYYRVNSDRFLQCPALLIFYATCESRFENKSR